MTNKLHFVRWTLIYLMLILGYLYLYAIDADKLIYGSSDQEEVKSKIDFVYQQY